LSIQVFGGLVAILFEGWWVKEVALLGRDNMRALRFCGEHVGAGASRERRGGRSGSDSADKSSIKLSIAKVAEAY
jgi:hypothetical protein